MRISPSQGLYQHANSVHTLSLERTSNPRSPSRLQ